MATWTYLASDLATNKTVAELPLTGVSMTTTLNATGTFSGEFACAAIKKGDPSELTVPARTAIYALADGVPQWGGILWTRSYDSESGRVRIAGSDWWSYYDHRKIVTAPIPAGGVDTAAEVVEFVSTEQNEIARQLLAIAHAHTGGNLGVVVDGVDTGTAIDQSYAGFQLVDVGEALRKLVGLDGGPDMMFGVAGVDADNRPIRVLRLGSPHLGQQGSPHVLQYGRNCVAYTWPSDGSKMATRSWATGNGMEVGMLMSAVEDTGKYAGGWMLLEQEKGYPSVDEQETLDSYAAADQRSARLPVVLPTLKIRADKDPRIGEYAPGDDAKVRIPAGDLFFRNGKTATMRIVQIGRQPGEQFETAALTMSPISEDAV